MQKQHILGTSPLHFQMFSRPFFGLVCSACSYPTSPAKPDEEFHAEERTNQKKSDAIHSVPRRPVSIPPEVLRCFFVRYIFFLGGGGVVQSYRTSAGRNQWMSRVFFLKKTYETQKSMSWVCNLFVGWFPLLRFACLMFGKWLKLIMIVICKSPCLRVKKKKLKEIQVKTLLHPWKPTKDNGKTTLWRCTSY